MAMPPERQRELEKRLGRKLTRRELIMEDGIEREDTRSPVEQMAANAWRPVPAKKPDGSEFDDEIARAERAVEEERVMKMTDGERLLHQLKKAKREKLAEIENDAAYQAQLKRYAPQLQVLRKIEESMRWDPDSSYGDLETVRQAVEQIEYPNSDPEVNEEIYAKALGVERRIRSAKRDAVLAKMNELGAEREALDAAQAELDAVLNPQVAAEDSTDYDTELSEERLAEIKAETKAKYDAIMESIEQKSREYAKKHGIDYDAVKGLTTPEANSGKADAE